MPPFNSKYRTIIAFVRLFPLALCLAYAKENLVQHNVKVPLGQTNQKMHTKVGEDNIPVIEIKGEGKPMTAAQIRALEEEAEGKPLDIKIKNTWVPKNCPVKAKRLDFVTFHYKGFLEDGKKFDHTYGREPVTIQLGVGMTLPGLDKGIRGACEAELRKITIPWRLARRKKSKIWKNVPKEEHWITFDVEIFHIEPWSPKVQFQSFDLDKDSFLTVKELIKLAETMHKDYGKTWLNDDIDNALTARYFVEYFDVDRDKKVSLPEYEARMEKDRSRMNSSKQLNSAKQKSKLMGRKRDPGLAWILDFNNDSEVDRNEIDAAPDLIEKGPEEVQKWVQEAERNLTKIKTEL